MTHTPSETVPGRVRMRLAHAAGWRSCCPPLAPMTRAGQRTAASRGAKWSGVLLAILAFALVMWVLADIVLKGL
jgi:hypothetical protein